MYNLPLRKDDLANAAAYVQQTSCMGQSPYRVMGGMLTEKENRYWGRTLTAQEVDCLLQAVYAANGRWTWRDTVVEIVEEEVAYYFSGGRTAAETAKIIQNRVQTYLDEQA